MTKSQEKNRGPKTQERTERLNAQEREKESRRVKEKWSQPQPVSNSATILYSALFPSLTDSSISPNCFLTAQRERNDSSNPIAAAPSLSARLCADKDRERENKSKKDHSQRAI